MSSLTTDRGAESITRGTFSAFQWRNLYANVFGECTYPPPIAKNPSTTTAVYPQQLNVNEAFPADKEEGIDSDLESIFSSVATPSHGQLATTSGSVHLGGSIGGRSSLLSTADSHRAAESDYDPFTEPSTLTIFDMFSRLLAGAKWSRNRSASSSRQVPHEDAVNDWINSGANRRESRASSEDSMLMLGLNMYPAIGDANQCPLTKAATVASALQSNPQSLPSEIVRLQQESWMLLMDQDLLRRLLENVSFKLENAILAFQRLTERASGGKQTTMIAAGRNEVGAVHSPGTDPTGRTKRKLVFSVDHPTFREQGNLFFGVGLPPPQPPPSDMYEKHLIQFAPLHRVLLETNELTQLLDAFSPFFAAISPFAVIGQFQDRYRFGFGHKHVSDVVGLPLLSQFATWAETFENRKNWGHVSLPFFLVNDVSYNFTQITALFVLLSGLSDHVHVHTVACWEQKMKKLTVPITLQKDTVTIATDDTGEEVTEGELGKDIGRRGRQLHRAPPNHHKHATSCPLLAVEEIAQDLLLVLERSAARASLNVFIRAQRFLINKVLDREATGFFFSRDTLFGANCLARSPRARPVGRDATRSSGQPTGSATSPAAWTPGGGASSGAQQGFGMGLAAGRGKATKNWNTSPSRERLSAPSRVDDLTQVRELLDAQRYAETTKGIPSAQYCFSDADFMALFALSEWFVDAATANSYIPSNLGASEATGTVMTTATPTKSGVLSMLVPAPSSSKAEIRSAQRVDATGSSAEDRRVSKSLKVPPPSGNASMPAPPTPGAGLRADPSVTSRASLRAPLERIPSRSANIPPSPPSPPSQRRNSQPHGYLPLKAQQYEATRDLTEAILAYEWHRTKMVQRHISSLPKGRHTFSPHSPLNGVGASSAARKEDGAKKASSSLTEEVTRPLLDDVSVHGFPLVTTALSTPLIMISSYIRLHGTTWLRGVIERLVVVLRRQSIKLYVNRLELEEPPPLPAAGLAGSAEGGEPALLSPPEGQPPSKGRATAKVEAVRKQQQLYRAFLDRMGNLEDTICQDIDFAMTEFFAAIVGNTAEDRLPQSIASIVTNFCCSIHHHLLWQRAALPEEAAAQKPVDVLQQLHRIQRYLNYIAASNYRSEQNTGSSAASVTGHIPAAHANGPSIESLVVSITRFRLARFLLFDAWILPTLNNFVALGFVPEDASLHLRWNMDAFARYLKILVNAPFAPKEEPQRQVDSQGSRPTSASLSSQYLAATYQSGKRHRGRASPIAGENAANSSTHGAPKVLYPRRELMAIPPFITGIYDISSGCLLQLWKWPTHDPTFDGLGGGMYSDEDTDGNGSVTPEKLDKSLTRHTLKGSLDSSSLHSRNVQMDLLSSSNLGASYASAQSPRLPQWFSETGRPLRTPSDPLGVSASPLGYRVPSAPQKHQQSGLRLPPISPPSVRNNSNPVSGQVAGEWASSLPGGVARHWSPSEDSRGDGATYFTPQYENVWRAWSDLSPALRSLNTTLGIVDYEPGEDDIEGEEDEELNLADGAMPHMPTATHHCSMRLLERFCHTAASECSVGIVASEFSVAPRYAAMSADNLLAVIEGSHPVVMGNLPPINFGRGNALRYLSSLHSTLLHPLSMSEAMYNVYRNNRLLFNALLEPLEAVSSSQKLFTAALKPKDGYQPVVDTNALLQLISGALTTISDAEWALLKWCPDSLEVPESATLLMKEVRRLVRDRNFLCTSAMDEASLNVLLDVLRSGPTRVHSLMQVRDQVLRLELGMKAPEAAQAWWRCVAVALCAKAMKVVEECQGSQRNGELAQWWNTQRAHLSASAEAGDTAVHMFIDTAGKMATNTPHSGAPIIDSTFSGPKRHQSRGKRWKKSKTGRPTTGTRAGPNAAAKVRFQHSPSR